MAVKDAHSRCGGVLVDSSDEDGEWPRTGSGYNFTPQLLIGRVQGQRKGDTRQILHEDTAEPLFPNALRVAAHRMYAKHPAPN